VPRRTVSPRTGGFHGRAHAARAARHAAAGALFGYLVLHPVAMGIFRVLDGPSVPGSPGETFLRALGEAFHPHMLPMGLLFALFCSAIGAADGWLRGLVLEQRAQLARLVRQLERERHQLVRLHEMHRRSTRFLVHDLKTHIGCILGFAELLGTSPAIAGDRECADAVARITRQAKKLMDGVTDLLELARMQEGHRPAREQVPVARLLDEVREAFLLPLHEGRLRIEAPDREAAPLLVAGDRKLLLRVLCNLVSNALSHAPEGTRVKLTVRLDPDDPEWLEFSCSDRGPGVPPEALPHIFDEFRSGRGSSGLGLAFCKAAVEAHGGTIQCQSSPGEGCTFTVRLPRTVPKKEAPHERHTEATHDPRRR